MTEATGFLSSDQGAHLVSIARQTVETAVTRRRVPSRGELAPFPGGADGFLMRPRGAFVTLTKANGALRGCIGIPYPVKPLGDAVIDAAFGAATRDPRFPMVNPIELAYLRVEVSALTIPETIECDVAERPKHVRIGTDGLIVSGYGTSGLLLPQVAIEMGLTPKEFLSLTCQKAGLLPDAWVTREVQLRRFQAEVFGEPAPRGAGGELRAST